MKRISIGFTLLICSFMLNACSQTSDMSVISLKDRIHKIETNLIAGQSIQERMLHHQVPGLSIAVINEFDLEWSEGYGVLDIRGKDPVSADSIFQVASISKPVTAVAALHYVETGYVGLHMNVNDVLTSWKIPENEFTAQADVTLYGLLSHTGGINQGLYKGYLPSEKIPTLIEVLNGSDPANSPPVQVDRFPGSEEFYSNGGYLITAQLLEDLSGQSFSNLTQEVIFQPLEMRSSTFDQFLPSDQESRTATAHGWDVENWQFSPGLPGKERWRIEDPGCSGLWTTAPDLAVFTAEIMNAYQGESELVISQETARMMFEPVWEGIPLQEPYPASQALGFSLIEIGNASYWIHFGGAFPGYISVLLADPETGFGIVVLTNAWGGGYEIIWEIIFSILYSYGKLPTDFQILQIGYSLVVFLAGLIWSGKKLLNRSLKKENKKISRWTGEAIILLAILLGILTLTYLYRGPYGGWMVQDRGSTILVKALLGVFFSTPLILLIGNILVWRKGKWSRSERTQFSLISFAGILGIFLLRDLWNLMFWG